MREKKWRFTIRDSNSENAEAMQEKKWRFTIHDSNSENAVAMQRREKGKMGDNLKRKVYLKRTRYRHVSVLRWVLTDRGRTGEDLENDLFHLPGF